MKATSHKSGVEGRIVIVSSDSYKMTYRGGIQFDAINNEERFVFFPPSKELRFSHVTYRSKNTMLGKMRNSVQKLLSICNVACFFPHFSSKADQILLFVFAYLLKQERNEEVLLGNLVIDMGWNRPYRLILVGYVRYSLFCRL